MNTELKTITPELARQMLERNVNNRRISLDRVDHLAREMASGNWVINGESIKFSQSRLIDGQHRLNAIVKANTPVQTLVIEGLPDDAFATIDQGRKRSGADVLTVNGESHPLIMQAAIRTVMDVMDTSSKWKRSSHSVPNKAFLDFVEQYPEIRESVNMVAHMSRGLAKLSGYAIPTAMHHLFARVDRDRANIFIDQLHTGVGLDTNSPIYLLRERLIENSANRNKVERTQIMAIWIKAWNAWYGHKTVKRLLWNSVTEDFPMITGLKY